MQVIIRAGVAVGVETGEIEVVLGENVEDFWPVDCGQVHGMNVIGGGLGIVQRIGFAGRPIFR